MISRNTSTCGVVVQLLNKSGVKPLSFLWRNFHRRISRDSAFVTRIEGLDSLHRLAHQSCFAHSVASISGQSRFRLCVSLAMISRSSARGFRYWPEAERI